MVLLMFTDCQSFLLNLDQIKVIANRRNEQKRDIRKTEIQIIAFEKEKKNIIQSDHVNALITVLRFGIDKSVSGWSS